MNEWERVIYWFSYKNDKDEIGRDVPSSETREKDGESKNREAAPTMASGPVGVKWCSTSYHLGDKTGSTILSYFHPRSLSFWNVEL